METALGSTVSTYRIIFKATSRRGVFGCHYSILLCFRRNSSYAMLQTPVCAAPLRCGSTFQTRLASLLPSGFRFVLWCKSKAQCSLKARMSVQVRPRQPPSADGHLMCSTGLRDKGPRVRTHAGIFFRFFSGKPPFQASRSI